MQTLQISISAWQHHTVFRATGSVIERKIDSSLLRDTMIQRGDYIGNQTTKYDEIDFRIPFSGGLGFIILSRVLIQCIYSGARIFPGILLSIYGKWRFTFQTSYDLVNRQFAAPLSDCIQRFKFMEMNFNWYPAGTYTEDSRLKLE